jgi:amidohydrolase
LSFQEKETSKRVAALLTDFGLTPRVLAGTGVVAEVAGRNPTRKTIALRADLDALPVREANEVPYKSTNEGVMHACGHDAHTASLLTAARLLSSVREEIEGTVRFIFQPGEEKNPGGASMMINEGVLEAPPPAAIIGQHVMPLIPAGKVGFCEGKYMASSDEIYLRVVGKGGHGGSPHLAVDPIVVGAQILLALQSLVSRNANPRNPSVLTFGRFVAEGATNVIPGEATLAGTFRALDEAWRESALEKIATMARQIAEGMGARCEVQISKGYPCLINDAPLTRRVRKSAEDFLGPENVVTIEPTMGSEDFAFYSQKIPAVFYRLGTRNEAKGITSFVHTPTFDIDESSLTFAPGLMAWMAVEELIQA